MMSNLVSLVVRVGETPKDAEEAARLSVGDLNCDFYRRLLGNAECALTPLGRQQVRDLVPYIHAALHKWGKKLPNRKVVVVRSPSPQASETFYNVFGNAHEFDLVPFETQYDLNPQDYGVFDGLSWKQRLSTKLLHNESVRQSLIRFDEMGDVQAWPDGGESKAATFNRNARVIIDAEEYAKNNGANFIVYLADSGNVLRNIITYLTSKSSFDPVEISEMPREALELRKRLCTGLGALIGVRSPVNDEGETQKFEVIRPGFIPVSPTVREWERGAEEFRQGFNRRDQPLGAAEPAEC